jgi:ATP-dependent DNA helicase DinG
MSPSDELLWLSRIDAVIRSRAVECRRNVLVQSVSYARAKLIMSLSRYRDRFIWHDTARDSGAALELFRQRAGTGAVLISPSMDTGVNLPDDECRCIVWPKLPYPDMRSPVLRRLQREDPEQREHLMFKKLVQGCGRGNRHADDWCEAIVLDGHFSHAQRSMRKYAPAYWCDAVKTVLVLPPPLQL